MLRNAILSMMNKPLFLILVSILSASLFSACKDNYEDYSTSPNDVLTFSHDTLRFDTLFSTIGSSTKYILVYNNNKKPLLISSISLADGNNGFRLNVDGEKGSSFNNVEIREKDSIYIFVETTLKENNNNIPIDLFDSLVFITNTVKQQVILQAAGQDAYIWKKGGIIESDSTLKNDKPYLIYDSLIVKEGATLTIPEGTTLYLHDKAKIDVHGTLKIQGKQGNPVTIRGDRLDKLWDISYDLRPGQWAGIQIYPESFNNEINHARIRNGVHGIQCDSSDVSQSKLKITNTILTNVYYNLLTATNCDIEASNCEFSNAGGALASLTGGSYSFVHCTFANHFTGSRSGASLYLRNYKMKSNAQNPEDTTPLPLLKADFLNSIITGQMISEIYFDKVNEEKHPNIAFNYRMDHCLLKMKYEDLSTSNITNYILNEKPEFGNLNDYKDYVFSFLLKPESPAIDKGSAAYMIPTDMNGEYRPTGTNPDLGAYEWVEQPKENE